MPKQSKTLTQFHQLQANDPAMKTYKIPDKSQFIAKKLCAGEYADLSPWNKEQFYLSQLMLALAGNTHITELTISAIIFAPMLTWLEQHTGSLEKPELKKSDEERSLSLVDVLGKTKSVTRLYIIGGNITLCSLDQLCDVLPKLDNITYLSVKLYGTTEFQKQAYINRLKQNTTLKGIDIDAFCQSQGVLSEKIANSLCELHQGNRRLHNSNAKIVEQSKHKSNGFEMTRVVEENRYGQFEAAKKMYLLLSLIFEKKTLWLPIELLENIVSYIFDIPISTLSLKNYQMACKETSFVTKQIAFLNYAKSQGTMSENKSTLLDYNGILNALSASLELHPASHDHMIFLSFKLKIASLQKHVREISGAKLCYSPAANSYLLNEIHKLNCRLRHYLIAITEQAVTLDLLSEKLKVIESLNTLNIMDVLTCLSNNKAILARQLLDRNEFSIFVVCIRGTVFQWLQCVYEVVGINARFPVWDTVNRYIPDNYMINGKYSLEEIQKELGEICSQISCMIIATEKKLLEHSDTLGLDKAQWLNPASSMELEADSEDNSSDSGPCDDIASDGDEELRDMDVEEVVTNQPACRAGSLEKMSIRYVIHEETRRHATKRSLDEPQGGEPKRQCHHEVEPKFTSKRPFG